jgi:arginyl-tRNA synthetase
MNSISTLELEHQNQLDAIPTTMATLDLGGLATKLEELGLGPIPQFSEAHVLNKPLDIARSYLADILRSLVGCDPITAYNFI